MSRTRNERRARTEAFAWAVVILALAVLVWITAVLYIYREEPEPVESETLTATMTWTAPAPAAEEPEPAEDFENEKIEAALLQQAESVEGCTITHYCICKKCCGKAPDHPAYGITASGRKATPGVSVAVDPSIIPLGSDVLVDYGDGQIHYYRADDTGSAIKGAHIDLCVEGHQTALNHGVKTATVYWVAPEE